MDLKIVNNVTFSTELNDLDDHELFVGKVNKQANFYPSIHLLTQNSEIPMSYKCFL